MKKEVNLIRYARQMTACVLAFLLLVSCFGANASDVYTRQDLDKFNENVQLLTSLGLAEKSRDAATTIKRGDFAAIMLKYLGYGEEFFAGGSIFSDIPNQKSPVYGMYRLGLLNGYPDGTFRPDDDILAEQAVKVFVTALGYKTMAEAMGGYPSGYLAYANQTELLRNTQMQGQDILTYFNLVQMMTNALTIELVEQNSNGGYYISDETWLSSRLDLEKHKGVVTAAQGVSIDEDGKKWKNTITINGVLYGADGDYSHLIGCYTEFYVNGDDEIVYIVEKRTVRQEFPAEKVLSYGKKTYTVETEDGKEKNYKLAQDNYIIFNGESVSSLHEDDMCPKYGKVTLIDNDSDGKYDTVLIDSFDVYSVQSINQTDKLIYYKNANGKFLDFGDVEEENLTIVNASGKTIGFEEISTDCIIRVAFSKDKEKAKIIISTNVISGTVTSITTDRIYTIVSIDNIPYMLVDEQINPQTLFVGRSGMFYLDSEGMIAAIPNSDSAYSYGYLTKAYMTEDGETLKIEIFDTHGNILTLNGAAKINIDGLNRQKADKVIELLKKNTESVVKQIIRFKCNSEGEIKEIDTPYNSSLDMTAKPQNGESKESLRLIYSGNTHYVKQLHNFVGKINVDSDTIVIVAAGDDSDDYVVKRVSELPDKTDFKLEAYSDTENEFFANLIFSSDRLAKNGGSDGDVLGVVTKINIAINSDEEAAQRISFSAKLFDKDLFLETELVNPFPYSAAQEPQYSLEVGDIVTLQYADDTASNVALVYKPSENLFPAGSKYAGLTEARVHYIYGDVYSIEKGFVSVTQKDIAADGAPTMNEVESFKLSDFVKILKCIDSGGKKKIVPATSADVVDYKMAGENCSKVFIAVEWEYPNIMVIYD